MKQRVVVFLDWQNVYRRGRAAFGLDPQPHTFGQVDPLALAHRICGMKPDRELAGVRIYRGLPKPGDDPKGYAANRRQTSAWMARDNARTHVFLRPLQYLPGLDPREKGIDVQLAIDFVMMAILDEYDVGVMFSVDTDLNPALEAVANLGTATPEVAAWNGPFAPPKRLGEGKGLNLWCNWLHKEIFEGVADPRDYSVGK